MFQQGDQISSPRPFFDENDVRKGIKRLMMGTKNAGVYVDISKEGIKFSGYYTGSSDNNRKYACVRDPVEITWDEFEKIKKSVLEDKPKRKRRKTKKKEEVVPDKIDTPDQEYLDTLPVVTINSGKYYIDANRRERRSVRNPEQVFNF